jgi:hypothetical protein
MAESGEGFLSDGGIDWGEVKGGKEGERGGFIDRGLDGQLGRGDGAGVTPVTLLEREEKPLEKNGPTGGSRRAVREGER